MTSCIEVIIIAVAEMRGFDVLVRDLHEPAREPRVAVHAGADGRQHDVASGGL